MSCDSAYELMTRGRALLEEGRCEQAALELERARELEPERGSILELLGRAHYGRRDYGNAANAFEEALGADPTNDYAHYCLGLCYLKLLMVTEAGRHFKIAWSLRPLDMYREKASVFCDGAGGGGKPSGGGPRPR